jgi:hypothetical protein
MELMGVSSASSAVHSMMSSTNLILVVCRDQERREHNFWINTRSNEFLALDHSLPQDAVPIATSKLQNNTQTIYYYSEATKTLYHKKTNGSPFAESPIQSARLMEKLRNIKFVEGRLQVENEEGIVYEMDDTENKKRIVKLTPHWMTSRQATWANDVVQLCRTQSSSNSLEIQGIRLADGTAIACWYDQTLNHFTFASQALSREKLIHLGLATHESGAWFFQPNAGCLYLLPTFTPEAATTLFSNQKGYFTLLRLSTPQTVLPHEKVERTIRLDDGRIIAWTQSGFTFLLEPQRPHHPFVLAVNQDWLSREADQQSHLTRLVSDENYRFHSKIDLPQTGSHRRSRFRNWYDTAHRKMITIPVGKLPAGGDYVGFAPSGNIAYFGNRSSLIALSETETTQEAPATTPTLTRFFDPNRNTNVLSLRIKSPNDTIAITPPMLAGIDTLALHGDINRLAFNQPFWDHHRLILLDPLPATSHPHPNSSSLGTLELNFLNADNLIMRRNEGSSAK